MRVRFLLGAAVVASLTLSGAATAQSLLVNFETNPNLPQGPDTFTAAGSAQTIAIPGRVTFTGGVVLGLPLNTPAIRFATSPNVYGTSEVGSQVFEGDPLLPVIAVDIDPLYPVNLVEGVVANGRNVPESYTVTAFLGSAVVDSQSFADVPANFDSGSFVFSLNAPLISRVEIAGSNTAEFNFLTDTFSFNAPIPEPAAFATLPAVAALLASRRRGRGGTDR